MPSLSVEERNRLLGQYQAGVSPTKLSKIFKVSRQAVYKILKKSKQENSLKNKHRSGRPKVTDAQTDANLVEIFRANPFKTVRSAISETGLKKDTIRRRLALAGLRSYRPVLKPKLTETHKEKRLQWAEDHVRWTQLQWRNVLFCDEISSEIDVSDKSIRCYRKKEERFHMNMILEKKNRGYGSVNVWGGIFGNFKTPLVRLQGRVTADVYVHDILRPYVLPFLHANEGGILMHDNAPPHTARLTKEFIVSEGVEVLPWPAVSPDFNPIENVWASMKTALRKLPVSNDSLAAWWRFGMTLMLYLLCYQ